MEETHTTITRQEAIAALTRWFEDIWSKGDMQAVDDILDPSVALILTFAQTHGIEQFKRVLTVNRNAFENLTYRIDEIVSDGNAAAAYWTMHTTRHRATWNNVEPSGKQASIRGMAFFSFANGKIVEVKVLSDVYGLMSQLGAIKT
ncbi:ester cyclase [Sorangium sp. So ce118]